MQLDDNNEINDDNDDDESRIDNGNDDCLESAGALLEEEDTELCKNRLLCDVVCKIGNFSIGAFVPLLNPSYKALAVFKTVELQAPVFFLSC
jgi:hypothetical protein